MEDRGRNITITVNDFTLDLMRSGELAIDCVWNNNTLHLGPGRVISVPGNSACLDIIRRTNAIDGVRITEILPDKTLEMTELKFKNGTVKTWVRLSHDLKIDAFVSAELEHPHILDKKYTSVSFANKCPDAPYSIDHTNVVITDQDNMYSGRLASWHFLVPKHSTITGTFMLEYANELTCQERRDALIDVHNLIAVYNPPIHAMTKSIDNERMLSVTFVVDECDDADIHLIYNGEPSPCHKLLRSGMVKVSLTCIEIKLPDDPEFNACMNATINATSAAEFFGKMGIILLGSRSRFSKKCETDNSNSEECANKYKKCVTVALDDCTLNMVKSGKLKINRSDDRQYCELIRRAETRVPIGSYLYFNRDIGGAINTIAVIRQSTGTHVQPELIFDNGVGIIRMRILDDVIIKTFLNHACICNYEDLKIKGINIYEDTKQEGGITMEPNATNSSVVSTFNIPEDLAKRLSELLTKKMIREGLLANNMSDPVKYEQAENLLVPVVSEIEAIKYKITNEYVPEKYRSEKYFWNYDGYEIDGTTVQIMQAAE